MFGTSKFKTLIDTLKTHNLPFKLFSKNTVTDHNRSVFLRHDVDFSVDIALDVAAEEIDMGIFANYFFMISSNTYNLLSAHNIQKAKDIQAMGHNISLHFDPTVYQDIDRGFKLEKTIFEDTFHTSLDIISIHRPGDFLTTGKSFDDCLHTYEDILFKEMSYVSDSGGRDPMDGIKKYINGKEKNPLHLLLHPIWWNSKSQSPSETLNMWMDDQIGFLIEETLRNCKTYSRKK